MWSAFDRSGANVTGRCKNLLGIVTIDALRSDARTQLLVIRIVDFISVLRFSRERINRAGRVISYY